MRLIIKEYILQLKEKDELDELLSELFVQKGYIADNQPKTGNRQFGVDIQLHNDKELLLLVVKQGDITRDVWDGNKNAVRPSLDEIKDVAIKALTYEELQKKIRIIVATNGRKDEATRANWSGYVNDNQRWNQIPIEISFMGIDEIVKEIVDNFFNEYLFEVPLHSAMRKALYFVGEGEYKRGYYEQIVDSIIGKIKESGSNKKKFNKACSTLYLASQMICQFAHDEGIVKTAIMVSEYVVIRYWKYLVEADKLEKKSEVEWLIKFCKSYERWNEIYVDKIARIAKKEIILPNYNVVENRVLLYEILGCLSSYCNYLLEFNCGRAKDVLNIIVALLNEYPYFVYAPYDSSIGIMIMIYKIFYHYNRIDEIGEIMERQLGVLMRFYVWQGKFPAPSDSFEEAMKIENKSDEVNYDVSAFWGYSLLLMHQFKCMELYAVLNKFLKQNLSSVTKCTWFLRKDEELALYNPWAMNLAGEGIEVPVEDDFNKFQNGVKFILEQYRDEAFSFDEYSFSSLEILICHYYGYIPRVKFNK
ncbi:MAG: hypothetical protein J6J79_03585 [Lachnospiraceae bacterium]|nr:hypothetical protein [Lachnospiraceae bacterium]